MPGGMTMEADAGRRGVNPYLQAQRGPGRGLVDDPTSQLNQSLNQALRPPMAGAPGQGLWPIGVSAGLGGAPGQGLAANPYLLAMRALSGLVQPTQRPMGFGRMGPLVGGMMARPYSPSFFPQQMAMPMSAGLLGGGGVGSSINSGSSGSNHVQAVAR